MKQVVEKFSQIHKLRRDLSQNEACVSIILPLRHSAVDSALLQKAIGQVKEHLFKNFPEAKAEISGNLDELLNLVQFPDGAAGIGLFVSKNVKQVIPFLFPVIEKVVISNHFEINDLLYDMGYTSSYAVMHLTGKEARLFRGQNNTLHEIKDDHFPRSYNDDYEYARPSRGSSYVGEAFIKEYEQDKSRLKKIRYGKFLKDIDNMLNPYLHGEDKLILAGTVSDVSQFKIHTRHYESIAGQVIGNYSHRPLQELSDLAWKVSYTSINKEKQDLISEFKEMLGTGRAISGIEEIWNAANQGRGYKLLIEKNFSHPEFLYPDNDPQLYRTAPEVSHFSIPNVGSRIIEIMLQKKGYIIVVDNGALKSTGGIGLITRY